MNQILSRPLLSCQTLCITACQSPRGKKDHTMSVWQAMQLRGTAMKLEFSASLIQVPAFYTPMNLQSGNFSWASLTGCLSTSSCQKLITSVVLFRSTTLSLQHHTKHLFRAVSIKLGGKIHLRVEGRANNLYPWYHQCYLYKQCNPIGTVLGNMRKGGEPQQEKDMATFSSKWTVPGY